MHAQDTLERPVEREVIPVPPPWLVIVSAIAVGLTLAVAVLAATFFLPIEKGIDTTRAEFTDKAGRHCTQVGTTALDCDYPPAENRLGDALNGLVNP